MLLLSTLLLSLSFGAYAHPGHVEEPLSVTAQDALRKRHLAAAKCHQLVQRDLSARKLARRALRKRDALPVVKRSESSASASASTSATSSPYYSELQNSTCIQTPEVTEGPYFIREELYRQNITDGQAGLPVTLDIGVMDISDCSPLADAIVDIWHANATGVYSVASQSDNTKNSTSSGGMGGGQPSGGAPSGSGFGGPSASGAAASGGAGGSMGGAGGSMGAAPSGGMGGGGGGGGMATAATDQETFGRGAYKTNAAGIVEFQTVFPGFYQGRAVHIHTMILTNETVNANGSLASEEGHVRHIGQVFFDEDLTQKVVALSPYNQEVITRLTNAEDSIYNEEQTAGYNSLASVEWATDNIEDGLIAYITIGVDTTASQSITSISYHTSDNSTDASTLSGSAVQADASSPAWPRVEMGYAGLLTFLVSLLF